MDKAISIKDMSMTLTSYVVGQKDFQLKDINLEIKKGTIVGLIGKNGAGKTTLINTIMNIYKADEGKIEVLGVDNTSKEFVDTKNNIGVVLEELGIYESFNIENVNKLMGYAYKNWDKEYFFNLLDRFEAKSFKAIKEFSTGMKKKLALAIALGHKPDLLILDEPTANLDPFAREEIIDYIYDYTREEERTVLISSHILSDLEKICDYVVYIDKGEIKLNEEKDKLLERFAIIRVGKEDLDKIPKEIIISQEDQKYYQELLVTTENLPKEFKREFVTLDEIIVKLMRSGYYESNTL